MLLFLLFFYEQKQSRFFSCIIKMVVILLVSSYDKDFFSIVFNINFYFVLDQHAWLDFYSASSLKQQWTDIHVAPFQHIIMIRANQSLFSLLNAACIAEKQQIPILLSLVWPKQGLNPRSTALELSMLTITPPMQLHM